MLVDTANAQVWYQHGSDIEGDQDSESGHSLSLSGDGTVVAVGAHKAGYKGHVRIYNISSATLTKIGSDIEGEFNFDRNGHSVSLSNDGTVVAIGAHLNNAEDYAYDYYYQEGGYKGDYGHVRVYQLANDNWSQLGSDIDGESQGDNSGYSVSLSDEGTIVAVGAIQHEFSDTGVVKVYNFINNSWSQLGLDIIGEAAGDRFGHSVSLSSDGTIVAVGAIGNNNDTGHTRVFQLTTETPTDTGSGSGSGSVTNEPTTTPTAVPSVPYPTAMPTASPTTGTPTTSAPTPFPTGTPTRTPTVLPTPFPTAIPTGTPTGTPTTGAPTTGAPTGTPTTGAPTGTPTTGAPTTSPPPSDSSDDRRLLDLEIVAIVLGVAIFAVGLILLVSQSDTPKAGIPIPILIPTAEKPIAGTFNIGKLFF